METLKEEFSDSLTNMYDAGWNAALELAAIKIENEFRNAFGNDTLSSIATYIRTLKK